MSMQCPSGVGLVSQHPAWPACKTWCFMAMACIMGAFASNKPLNLMQPGVAAGAVPLGLQSR